MRLALEGHRVSNLVFSLQVTLQIEARYGVQIESELTLIEPSGASTVIDPETADGADQARLLHLVGGRIVRGDASAAGDLTLVLDSGFEVHVPHDYSYEAWNVTGPGGYRVISLTGDSGLAIWDSIG